ncbi:melanopsin-like isoform X2 [Ruditapes philippinarum]|uniref:melanopsin-like isoform X2 n=1 Tax=Ruditapes philippinarum TaxID=129788 RepID=UPI00295AC811|nr:melanopsin-like isoform X2 [Ruditapes philippinarum]
MTFPSTVNFSSTVKPMVLFNDTNITEVYNISEPGSVRPWNTLEKAVFGTWLSISMLCAVFGNLMVIVVVFRHKGMQTRTNMFLVNLAIADFLVGILLAPFSLTTLISEEWIFGEVMCNINGFMNAVCFITSIHTLMYISIHKYVSITRPFSRILNHWKILIMSAAAWLWAIVCAILTMFVLSKVVSKPGAMQCGPEYPRNNLEYLHHVIITGTNIVIPLAIMTFAYARMYCEFRSHAKRLRKNSTLQTDQILAQQIQVTKTLFIVLACFMLCWLPYFAYSSYVSTIKDKSKILAWANPAAYCFMYMNSGCNPIIYAWRSPSFREGYKEILCQKSGYIVSDEITKLFANHMFGSGNMFGSGQIFGGSGQIFGGSGQIFGNGASADKPSADTIRDSDSPGIIRRLSTMLHSSFRSTRLSTHRNSDDCSSLNSVHLSRTTSVSSPSHTLLRRATSKTAKGSSIIRKDGSVIITKNGKIISVRRDIDSLKRDKSFSGFEDMKTRHTNGLSKSFSELDMNEKRKIEFSPLLKANNNLGGQRSPRRSPLTSRDNVNSKFGHTSLTKIDSVDETETEFNDNRLRLPQRQMSRPSQSLTILPGEETSPSIHSQENLSISPSVKSDLDDVFVQSPEPVVFSSQEGMLNSMTLQPVVKDKKHLAKSDNQLDDINSTESSDIKKSKKSLSRSTNVVYKVPLLRYPSVEKLDVHSQIPRCSSDASSIPKLIPRSQLHVRRWLSNRNVDTTQKSKT